MTRKIAFLGGGNMATSLVGGLVESGHPPDDIVVSEPVAEKRRDLAERFAVGVTADNREAAAASDVVVLAVKPQDMAEVVTGAAGAMRERGPLVVSIAAGTRIGRILEWLGYPAAGGPDHAEHPGPPRLRGPPPSSRTRR